MKKWIVPLLGLFFGTSCAESSSSDRNFMAFDSVTFVDKFPVDLLLEGGTPLDVDIAGMQDFVIKDSLLIASTSNPKGFWEFLSLRDSKPLGRFIKKGNGPGELLMMPRINYSTFEEVDGITYATLHYPFKRILYRMNMNRTLESGSLQMEIINDSLPKASFGFLYIDDSTFFCKTITDDQTSQIRFFWRNGKKHTPSFLEQLNKARIKRGKDFNFMSTIIKCNAEKGRIVEMPVSLNHLNLYSFDGSFARTVCVGNKLDNIDELQRLSRAKLPYSYGHVRAYPDFFGVLFLGETKKSMQTKRKNSPRIQLFDWDGNPLAELRLNRIVTSFDFDLETGYLYTLDSNTEEFIRYDIKDLSFAQKED